MRIDRNLRHVGRTHIATNCLVSWLGRGTAAILLSTAVTPGRPAASPADPAAVIALLRAQDDAVLRVGERLIVAGLPLCNGSGRSAGFTVQLRAQYGGQYRAAAVSSLALGDLPTISSVAPGSAALGAGLTVGDQIAAIAGHRFSPVVPRRKSGDFGPTAAALDVIDAALAGGPVTLDVQRGGRSLAVRLDPRPACRARFDVRAGAASNATSDGTTVQVSSDLVADARGDGELAAILAHELAHNILRHPQRLKAREPALTTRKTEVEADRLGVWLLDAAGFPIDAATSFWARWGRAHDQGVFSDGTHPGWRARIATIEAEAAAIARLRGSGFAVRPPADLRAR